MATPLKVLVADPISPRGIEELSRDKCLEVAVCTELREGEILKLVGDAHGIIVRSQTKITAEILNAAKRLRVVGRAGVGVDNVDVETATRRGVVVLNAPGANTVSTAEHTFSLLLGIARNISRADATLKSGVWERKRLEGVELYNKTLGVIGMGRIGSELSRRAIAFGMRVLAFDPYLSAARAHGLQVELVEEINDLLSAADFITLHTPLTAGGFNPVMSPAPLSTSLKLNLYRRSRLSVQSRTFFSRPISAPQRRKRRRASGSKLRNRSGQHCSRAPFAMQSICRHWMRKRSPSSDRICASGKNLAGFFRSWRPDASITSTLTTAGK